MPPQDKHWIVIYLSKKKAFRPASIGTLRKQHPSHWMQFSISKNRASVIPHRLRYFHYTRTFMVHSYSRDGVYIGFIVFMGLKSNGIIIQWINLLHMIDLSGKMPPVNKGMPTPLFKNYSSSFPFPLLTKPWIISALKISSLLEQTRHSLEGSFILLSLPYDFSVDSEMTSTMKSSFAGSAAPREPMRPTSLTRRNNPQVLATTRSLSNDLGNHIPNKVSPFRILRECRNGPDPPWFVFLWCFFFSDCSGTAPRSEAWPRLGNTNQHCTFRRRRRLSGPMCVPSQGNYCSVPSQYVCFDFQKCLCFGTLGKHWCSCFWDRWP